jgi:hypothetical protein
MFVEAQRQVSFDKHPRGACVFIRVGVAARAGDRPLDDLAENSAELTLDEALSFAASILTEVRFAQRALDAERSA